MADATVQGSAVYQNSGAVALNIDISTIPTGSWFVVDTMWSASANTLAISGTNWTTLFGGMRTTGTRRNQTWAKVKESGDGSTITLTPSASMDTSAVVFWGTGDVPSTWLTSWQVRSDIGTSPRSQNRAPSIPNASAGSLALALTHEATNTVVASDEITAVTAGWSRVAYRAQTVASTKIETIGVYQKAMPTAGATGDVTFTYSSTQDNNGWAGQIVIPGIVTTPTPVGKLIKVGTGANAYLSYLDGAGVRKTPTRVALWLPGFDLVSELLAKPGATWAHRGGSTTWPEMSEYAYDQSVMRGYGALEFSAHRTSDGVWVGSHDPSLNRTSQTTGLPAISTQTWAQVQTYMNTLNSNGTARPYYRLDDMLDKYTKTHVVIADPKSDFEQHTEFFGLLDTHGGPTKIIAKFFGAGGGSTAFGDAAAARGYQSWGYFYEADYLDGDMARDQSHWSILGMNYDASQAAWDAVKSYGKPVVGHIAPSQAAYNMAISKGATMVQCANVAAITPVSK